MMMTVIKIRMIGVLIIMRKLTRRIRIKWIIMLRMIRMRMIVLTV